MKKIANVTLIEAAADIDKAIADVARKGKTLDNLIHRTGVSCIYHAQQCGDTRKIDALVEAMPKSSRRKGLIKWLEDHVPCDPDATINDKDGYKLKLRKGRSAEEFKIQEAAEKPFWKYTSEREVAPMTIERAIANFEKALKKAVTDGKASADDTASLLKALKSANTAANDADAPADVVSLSKAAN